MCGYFITSPLSTGNIKRVGVKKTRKIFGKDKDFKADYLFNVVDLGNLPSPSPFCKGGYRGIFITLCKISPNPSLKKRGL